MSSKYAVYCGNAAVHTAMVASCKSLLANSSVDQVWLLTDTPPKHGMWLDGTRANWRVVDNKWFKPDGPNMTSHFTWLAMLRAALCHILDVDKVLSLDCDTVCVGNIDDVWSIDISDAYFAASIEPHRTHNGFVYMNTGVCLYNLEKLRNGKADEVIDVLNRQQFSWVEQDVFNYLCQGYMAVMPSRYNTNPWTQKCTAPKIKHFAGQTHYLHEAEFREWL